MEPPPNNDHNRDPNQDDEENDEEDDENENYMEWNFLMADEGQHQPEEDDQDQQRQQQQRQQAGEEPPQQQPQQQQQQQPAPPLQQNQIGEVIEHEGLPRIEQDVLDGGMPPEINKPRTTDCDLILYLQCAETIGLNPTHPILKTGVKVGIGLDKGTKLGAVFNRYVAFCNDQSRDHERVSVDQLEFVHCSVLHPSDTAEASALMKSDIITVQTVREVEREAETDRRKKQAESDRQYFDSLRCLFPDLTRSFDLVLDCRGKLVDENGFNQGLLSTSVRGHAAILSKRCRWLANLIRQAKEEQMRKSVVTIPENDHDIPDDRPNHFGGTHGSPRSDGEDTIHVVPYPSNSHDRHRLEELAAPSQGANEIENDDDDDDDDRENSEKQRTGVDAQNRLDSRMNQDMPTGPTNNQALWVTIENHPPHAIKLLLEYCYTNRVLCLGQKAFEESCHPAPNDVGGPVLPVFSQWNDNEKEGRPHVSFAVAVAGIALAEEAGLKRLSLMCESAAAQLVDVSNVVEALSTCSRQFRANNNELDKLRTASMNAILGNGQRGVIDLYRTQRFKRALKDFSADVVPTLLEGTTKVLSSPLLKNVVEQSQNGIASKQLFARLDQEDLVRRKEARKQHREFRRQEPCVVSEDDRVSIAPNSAVAVAGIGSETEGWERQSSMKRTLQVWKSGRHTDKHTRHNRNLRRRQSGKNP